MPPTIGPITRLMRTAPLRGNRFETQFLHDGRASTVTAAILAHDGTAKPSRDAFNNLSATSKDLLLRFVHLPVGRHRLWSHDLRW